jgi:hypothetical protein
MKKIISKILLATMAVGLMAPSFAGAATLTDVSVALSNHTVNASTNVTLSFVATTAITAGQTITFDTPDAFTLDVENTVVADIDLLDDGVQLAIDETVSGATWGIEVISTTDILVQV